MSAVADTYYATIFIAGDLSQAKQVCREFCTSHGLCVTVDATAFIYTGGEESGVRIGLINYPRFPTTPQEIREKAIALATILHERLCQHSYSIVLPEVTIWHTTRTDR